jgi:hypothetical protein
MSTHTKTEEAMPTFRLVPPNPAAVPATHTAYSWRRRSHPSSARVHVPAAHTAFSWMHSQRRHAKNTWTQPAHGTFCVHPLLQRTAFLLPRRVQGICANTGQVLVPEGETDGVQRADGTWTNWYDWLRMGHHAR